MLLPADEIAKLLSSDDLNVPNEELMFQALMLWLRHDLPERKKELPHLLSLIKLPLIPPQVRRVIKIRLEFIHKSIDL